MAKSSNSPKEANNDTIKAAILDAVASLWEEHVDQISRIREKAEDKSVTVNFANKIDCSETQATVETNIRFCETFTDKRTNKIEDASQGKFETIENAGRGGRKGGDKDKEKGEGAEKE